MQQSTWATSELETARRLLLQVTELIELDRPCIWTYRPETFPYVSKEVVINSDQTAIPAEKSPSRQKPRQLQVCAYYPPLSLSFAYFYALFARISTLQAAGDRNSNQEDSMLLWLTSRHQVRQPADASFLKKVVL